MGSAPVAASSEGTFPPFSAQTPRSLCPGSTLNPGKLPWEFIGIVWDPRHPPASPQHLHTPQLGLSPPQGSSARSRDVPNVSALFPNNSKEIGLFQQGESETCLWGRREWRVSLRGSAAPPKSAPRARQWLQPRCRCGRNAGITHGLCSVPGRTLGRGVFTSSGRLWAVTRTRPARGGSGPPQCPTVLSCLVLAVLAAGAGGCRGDRARRAGTSAPWYRRSQSTVSYLRVKNKLHCRVPRTASGQTPRCCSLCPGAGVWRGRSSPGRGAGAGTGLVPSSPGRLRRSSGAGGARGARVLASSACFRRGGGVRTCGETGRVSPPGQLGAARTHGRRGAGLGRRRGRGAAARWLPSRRASCSLAAP